MYCTPPHRRTALPVYQNVCMSFCSHRSPVFMCRDKRLPKGPNNDPCKAQQSEKLCRVSTNRRGQKSVGYVQTNSACFSENPQTRQTSTTTYKYARRPQNRVQLFSLLRYIRRALEAVGGKIFYTLSNSTYCTSTKPRKCQTDINSKTPAHNVVYRSAAQDITLRPVLPRSTEERRV